MKSKPAKRQETKLEMDTRFKQEKMKLQNKILFQENKIRKLERKILDLEDEVLSLKELTTQGGFIELRGLCKKFNECKIKDFPDEIA